MLNAPSVLKAKSIISTVNGPGAEDPRWADCSVPKVVKVDLRSHFPCIHPFCNQ